MILPVMLPNFAVASKLLALALLLLSCPMLVTLARLSTRMILTSLDSSALPASLDNTGPSMLCMACCPELWGGLLRPAADSKPWA